MKLFFIEMPDNYLQSEFELIYQIRKVTNDSYPNIYYLFRGDDYFANVLSFKNIVKDNSSVSIITNDDRLLSQYKVDKNNDLYFWNFRIDKFISYKYFYSNIRKENNIENMWRRKVFPDAYYALGGDNNEE